MINTWTPTQGHVASRFPPWPPRQLVSWVQTCCGFAILVVGQAKVEGADGKVPVVAHGLRLDVLVSKTQLSLLFQVMKNWYLIGTY